jgi:hypothetical protein
MNETKRNETKAPALSLEVEELERGRRPGGCNTSSSTSPLCTCPCRIDG